MTSCHTFYTFTRIVMLIKQFVKKNALNSNSGKTFSKECKRTRRFWAAAVSVNQQHPQLNGTKSVELEIGYARVHLLNEGGLYKMDQTKKDVLTSCSFITSRDYTDAVLTQSILSLSTLFPSVLVFAKHFFALRITWSNSSKVNKQQRVIQVTAAATSCFSKWVGIIPNVALAGLYAIPETSHQISGLVDRQAYTNNLVSRKQPWLKAVAG